MPHFSRTKCRFPRLRATCLAYSDHACHRIAVFFGIYAKRLPATRSVQLNTMFSCWTRSQFPGIFVGPPRNSGNYSRRLLYACTLSIYHNLVSSSPGIKQSVARSRSFLGQGRGIPRACGGNQTSVPAAGFFVSRDAKLSPRSAAERVCATTPQTRSATEYLRVAAKPSHHSPLTTRSSPLRPSPMSARPPP